jgi:PAS domain S-box-containing protein
VSSAASIVLALFLLSASLNRRLREREREEARFRMLAASSPNLVWTLGPAGDIEYINPRFAHYTGIPNAERAAADPFEIVHPDERAEVAQAWADALSRGACIKTEVRLRAADSTYRWHLVQVIPVYDEGTRIAGWIGSATDTHEQKQGHMLAQFLEEATNALGASLELHPALQRIAELLRRYADWCEIQFEDAVRERRSITCGDLSKALCGDLWTRTLTSEDRDIGSLTLVRADALGTFTETEKNLFDHLALRIATAIAQANLYEREHRVAQSFQQASLPTDLPKIPGVVFDAVYIPGGDEATVGGDWYDAVRLIDGRIIVSIGDVAGSGLEAAVTMGNVRQIIRGIAQVHADPGLMLDAADRALRIENADRFVTAFVGVLDPVARTFSYACAGHPPPMLRFPDGRVEMLSDGGLPLGLRAPGSGVPEHTLQLESGCVLVLYTDGLTEMQRTPVDGELRLREHLANADPMYAVSPARSIRRAMLDGSAPKDDVAILVMALTEEALTSASRHWTLDVTDASAAHTVRNEFAQALASRGFAQSDIEAAKVVLGELIGNTVRYASGIVEVIADWSNAAPVLHVLDRGPGFHHIAMLPRDLYSESGRGLFIVSALTQDFRVSKRAGGGSHARAVLTERSREFTTPPARSLAKALVGQ